MIQSLNAQSVNGEKWRDDSDEPTVLDHNMASKTAAQVGTTAVPGTFFEPSAYRSSDHDPLKVGFTLPTTGTSDTLDIDWGDGPSEPGLLGITTSRSHTYASTGA